MASSRFLRKLISPNLLTGSGSKVSFHTSKSLSSSIVPFRPPATGPVASLSRFIISKDFHLPVSRDDSVMSRVCDALDPRGWWNLMFMYEDSSWRVEMERTVFHLKRFETDEGFCFLLKMHRIQTHDLQVSVEDNNLFCEGMWAEGKGHKFCFELPKKEYQPTDVKASMKNGALMVTFANLKLKDFESNETEIK